MSEQNPQSPTSHFVQAVEANGAASPEHTDPVPSNTLPMPGSPNHITLPHLMADLTPGRARVDFGSAEDDFLQELRAPEVVGPIAINGAGVERPPENHDPRVHARLHPVISPNTQAVSEASQQHEHHVIGDGLTDERREFFETSKYDGPAIQIRLNKLDAFYRDLAGEGPSLHDKYGLQELPNIMNQNQRKFGTENPDKVDADASLEDKYKKFMQKNGIDTKKNFVFEKLVSDPKYRADKLKVLEHYYRTLVETADTLREKPELGTGNYVLTDKDSTTLWMARDISFRGMIVTHVAEAAGDGTLTDTSSTGIYMKNIPLDRLYPVESEDLFAKWNQ